MKIRSTADFVILVTIITGMVTLLIVVPSYYLIYTGDTVQEASPAPTSTPSPLVLTVNQVNPFDIIFVRVAEYMGWAARMDGPAPIEDLHYVSELSAIEWEHNGEFYYCPLSQVSSKALWDLGFMNEEYHMGLMGLNDWYGVYITNRQIPR